jgi:hypothetical protein
MRGENFVAHQCAAEHQLRITGVLEQVNMFSSVQYKQWALDYPLCELIIAVLLEMPVA